MRLVSVDVEKYVEKCVDSTLVVDVGAVETEEKARTEDEVFVKAVRVDNEL